MPASAATDIDLGRFVRPGDTVLWAQGAGEPTGLIRALIEQRASYPGVRVFLGLSYRQVFTPATAEGFQLLGMGGIGANRELARAGLLGIIPCRTSALPTLIAAGSLHPDVVLTQLSPHRRAGRRSLGVSADLLPAALPRARSVIGEIVHDAPWTAGDTVIDEGSLAAVVDLGTRLPDVAPHAGDEVTARIAAYVCELVADRSTIQLGVGGLADAIATGLRERRDLGIHTGLLTDRLWDLVECGAVTNAHKGIDAGRSVATLIVGTRELYAATHDRPDLALRGIDYTHAGAVLSALRALVSVNAALEVDLTGQANAETAAGQHIGAVGGHGDFAAAAARSPGGRSIIALPATTADGTRSRIVARLTDGVVTTQRSDIDTVVTEHGVADLRGADLRTRIRRLAAIAAPRFRDALLRDARAL